MNPYAPPRAHVDDVEDGDAGVQPVKVWSSQGRVGRLRYLAHLMGAYFVFMVLAFAGGFIGAMVRSEAMATAVTVIAVAVYLWFTVLKTIQRSHDMDWTGWSALLALIPLVNLVWIFKGGSEGRNRFGAPPPPNTTGVKVLAFLPLALFVIGIVAAIALPAYMQYGQRAAQQQNR
jgi:uncharacterized membrane protein YhaH (DUF805 family)